ncbi:MAG: glycosyltransferase family 4 protein [Bacteroidales bacterium]|nr:glycosyltransferase family 4 protein [Bacteroidales bacterium]MCF8397349.1 glycosyltransferase family 4 protein [Bacteroidales bacterium]
MNILIICNKSPFPPKEGGPIAMNAIIQGLVSAGHRVKVLGINTNKYHIPEDQIPVNYKKQTDIELAYIDLSIKPVDAFLNLFTNKSYHVQRFISKNFEERLKNILQSHTFDIIQFETLFITPYLDMIRSLSDARIVLRAHNIEHLIWERIAGLTHNPLKRFYLKHLARTLKNYELSALDHFDGIATITQQDKSFFEQHTQIPVIDISFGVDLNKFPLPKDDFEFPSLFHIGSMNWIPNIEGIRWFLDHVWLDIHREFPKLKFYLAGREMPKWLYKAAYPNVVVIGEVDDAWEFMQSKAIMLVPLLSGSGIRIKIIEGMALGKAVISTRIGAEGINCRHGSDILLADDPGEFREAINKCYRDIEFTHQLGKNARSVIESFHNNEKIIASLLAFYHKIL